MRGSVNESLLPEEFSEVLESWILERSFQIIIPDDELIALVGKSFSHENPWQVL
jgi:hypothetical protein